MEQETRSGVEELGRIAAAGQVLFASAAEPGAGGVPEADLVALVKASKAAVGAATAAQVVWIAQYAAHTEVQDADRAFHRVVRAVGFVDEFASDTLAPLLGMSPGAASVRVERAAKLTSDLPVTLGAVATGELDLFRAQCIAEELVEADHEVCAVVEELIHPEVCADTPMRVRHRVRAVLAELDPALVRQRAARARLERCVSMRASHLPGMTQWFAQLPTEESAKCWAAIDALARQGRAQDPTRTLEQHRADALVDLLLGNATVDAHLMLTLPVLPMPDEDATPHTDADTDFEATGEGAAGERADARKSAGEGADADSDADAAPAETAAETEAGPRAGDPVGPGCTWGSHPGVGVVVPGLGFIASEQVRELIGAVGVKISRMLIDPVTGATVETATASYRPSAAIARHVRLRDGTCRFPSCSRRAERAELDHVIPWPAGPTKVGNLICLCKHHHRLKHASAWRPELLADGVVIWTDPYGDRYATYPVDHRDLTTHASWQGRRPA